MVLPSLIFCLSVSVGVPFFQLKLSAALTDTAPRRQTASARTLSLIVPFLVPRKVVRGTASQNGPFALDWQEGTRCTVRAKVIGQNKHIVWRTCDAIAWKEHDRRQSVGGRNTDAGGGGATNQRNTSAAIL